jgi:hypothetical protein
MCKNFLAELDLFAAFGWIISRPLVMLQFIINFIILFYLKCMSAFSPSSIVSWIVGNADVRPDVFPASLPPPA